GVGRARAAHGEFYPVLDWEVFHLTHAPNVSGFDVVLDQRRPRLINHTYLSVRRYLESLVVGAVFLGLLSHESDVWYRSHGPRVEGAVLLAKGNCFLIDTSVTGVRDDG